MKQKDLKNDIRGWKDPALLSPGEIAGVILEALQGDFMYNPLCGRLVSEIKTGDILPRCEGCRFTETCFDVESMRAAMGEMTEKERG